MCGGGHAKDTDMLRFSNFTEKKKRDCGSIDLSASPPCKANLNLKILRANGMAYLLKRSSVAHVNEPAFLDCGWDYEGNIIWI